LVCIKIFENIGLINNINNNMVFFNGCTCGPGGIPCGYCDGSCCS